jgi:hypothetical protein
MPKDSGRNKGTLIDRNCQHPQQYWVGACQSDELIKSHLILSKMFGNSAKSERQKDD